MTTAQPRLRLYVAAPLFSAAEREFNKQLKAGLAPYFDVFLPQEDGGLIVDMVRSGVPVDTAVQQVFRIDVNAVEWCDYILIVFDGRSVDEGAAFELGYAFARGKTCIGLQTDPRRLLGGRNNPMLDCAVKDTFSSTAALFKWARAIRSPAPAPEYERALSAGRRAV